MPIRIIELNDANGAVAAPEWLAKAEGVHRQLRIHLVDYSNTMRRVFTGGARMAVAAHGDSVAGVAVYRLYENTFSGVHMYVDDLVTDESRRSTGVGKALLDHLEALARRSGCKSLTLDSGTQRQRAHRFYFREGYFAVAFHFQKQLSP